MQHGTGREAVQDLVENVQATLTRWGGRPYLDMVRALDSALTILDEAEDLDQRGEYGKDHNPNTGRRGRPLGPIGSIRDTRPEGLGR